MSYLVFVLTAFLGLATTVPARATDNLSRTAGKIESGISRTLQGIGATLASAAAEAGQAGPDREADLRAILRKCVAGRPYVIDAAFVDRTGTMKYIEPEPYRVHEGADISAQEVVVTMRRTLEPVMGNVFVTVEGTRSVDIEHPVFSRGKEFVGSLSVLVNQEEMIREVAAAVEKESGVKCWFMQKDGLILYETDPTQTGLNLFTDKLYNDYPELLALGRRMVQEPAGDGFYTFLIHGTGKVVKKLAAWKTARFYGQDWIVVAYGEAE